MEDNIETFISFSSEAVVRASEKNGKKYIVGVASSDSKDDYKTIFSNACQIGFVEDCQNFNILVELEHQEKFGHPFIKNIGKVVSASAIKENNKTLFQVETELNSKSFLANYVFDTVKDPDPSFGEPIKFGFSIYGVVQKSHFEYIDGEYTKIYDRVSLRRIAMTDHPSNPDTFVEAVSRASEQDNVTELPKVEPKQEQELINEEVIRDSITIQTDYGSASGLINQLANNQSQPIEETSEPAPKPQITSQELKAKLDGVLNEMVNQVKALQASGLTPVNMLCLMSELVEKYCEVVEELDDKIEYGSIEINDNQTVERSSEEQKENKLNVLLETLIEVKDLENAKQNNQQRICSTCSTDCKADGQQCESVSRSNIEQKLENQPEYQEVNSMENVEVVETTEKTTTVEVEPVKEELVSRASILEDMKSLMSEFTTSITSSFESKLSSVTAELEKVKQMPMTIAGNQLSNTVSRSSNSIASIRERQRNGEPISQQEREILQKDINRFLLGK